MFGQSCAHFRVSTNDSRPTRSQCSLPLPLALGVPAERVDELGIALASHPAAKATTASTAHTRITDNRVIVWKDSWNLARNDGDPQGAQMVSRTGLPHKIPRAAVQLPQIERTLTDRDRGSPQALREQIGRPLAEPSPPLVRRWNSRDIASLHVVDTAEAGSSMYGYGDFDGPAFPAPGGGLCPL